VWEQFPGAPLGGRADPQDLEALGYLQPGEATLRNDAIHVFADVDDNGLNPGDEMGRDAGGGFDYPLHGVDTGPGCQATAKCSWDPSSATTWQQNRQQDGVQAFYLANRYLAHLRALLPGFQSEDQLELRTDDGANNFASHHDNASMETFRDGTPSIMRMYLWGLDDGQRAVNGGDDAAILFHEYTHELDNRLVVDSDGDSTLGGSNGLAPQGGALDEGTADFMAKSFLADEGYQPDDPDVPGEVDMGAYTDATPHAIRTEALDCPVRTTAPVCPGSGYTYGDFAHVVGRAEFHADGEIWAQTLWDLRQQVGGPMAETLVVAGLPAAPSDPDFLDLRDAILAAAEARAAQHPGLKDTVWRVFARRGMGYYASSGSSRDTAPREDFEVQPSAGAPGSIHGIVKDAGTGTPLVGATVSIGNGRFVATTDGAGRYALSVPPAPYAAVHFRSPGGYDTATAGVDVASGQAAQLDEALRRDWVSPAGGATVLEGEGDGCANGRYDAVDGDPSTGWSAQWTDGHATPTITVKLPAAIDLTSLEALSDGVCGDDDGAAAKHYAISVSADGSAYQTLVESDFLTPGVMTVLPLDAAALAKARATRFVRITLFSPQDPSTYPGRDWVDLAELRAYGAPATAVAPAPTATPVATATPAPTVTPKPLARPAFTLRSSAKRSAVFTVTCAAACSVSGKLTVDARTAKKLRLGKTRVIGTLSRSVKPGKRATLTLSLNLKARRAFQRSKLKSFKATLAVGAHYAGDPAVSPHRTVKITR
jgi:extracellular elastinolytic metalloproteinase